jgi:hypothetical protein
VFEITLHIIPLNLSWKHLRERGKHNKRVLLYRNWTNQHYHRTRHQTAASTKKQSSNSCELSALADWLQPPMESFILRHKVKSCLCAHHSGIWWEERYRLHLFLILAPHGGERSVPRADCKPQSSRYPFKTRLDEPHNLYGCFGEQKTFGTAAGNQTSNPQPGRFVFQGSIETELHFRYILRVGRDSSVGMATRYGLCGPGIESRWGRDFPHPSLPAHPASYAMGTASFPGAKRPRRGVDHPPHLALRLKKE